jgi:hypothetical protein
MLFHAAHSKRQHTDLATLLLLLAIAFLHAPLTRAATSDVATFMEDVDAPTGRDEPVQLVRRSASGDLELVAEGVELLRSFSGVHHPVAVVGPFHSGKSFMLNKLMGRTTGFATGATVDPTTEGISMWGRPLTDSERSVIFLDTEGLAAPGNSADYDAKIFAVATLLSNHLFYNSVRIIDESSMEYLEVLARRARLLNANVTEAGGSNKATRLRQFPALTWVVQNFFQKQVNNETPDEWLSRLMDQQAEAKTGEFKYAGLRDIFPRRFCRTMFMPASVDQLFDLDRVHASDLDPRYRNDLSSLVAHLSSVLRENERAADALSSTALIMTQAKGDDHPDAGGPSTRALAAATCEVVVGTAHLDEEELQARNCDSAVTANLPRSGPELAHYLTVIVNAINNGRLAEVPSLWQLYLKQHIGQAREQVLTTFRTDMHMGLSKDHTHGGASSATIGGPGPHPLSEAAFNQTLKTTYKRCLALFKELIFDLASVSVEVQGRQLEIALDRLESHANDAYHRRVHEYLGKFREESAAKMDSFVQDLLLPQPSAGLRSALNRQVAELRETLAGMRENFPTKVQEAEGFLQESLRNYASTAVDKNDKALKTVAEAARSAAVERYETVFKEETRTEKDRAYTVAELESMNEKAKAPAKATWKQRSKVAANEKFYKGEEALFFQSLSESFAGRFRKNEALAEALLRDLVDTALAKAKVEYRSSISHMPLDDGPLATWQRRAKRAAEDWFQKHGQRYSAFNTYSQLRSKMVSEVETSIYSQFEQENTRAMMEKVHWPLTRAFRRAGDVKEQYWLKSSFVEHARKIAHEEIGDHLKETHKKRVIDNWLTSNEPGTAGSLANKMCFPAASTVEKEDGTFITMGRLQIGDRVRVGPTMFSSVYYFARREEVSGVGRWAGDGMG